MTCRAAAAFDFKAPTTTVRTAPRAQLFATVRRETGPLLGLDGIRIDASVGSLHGMARVRSRYLCPAILDLPGAGTGPVCSPLTTSELLVFASAERFEWVNLRNVGHVSAVRRARKMLHPSVRLSVSPSPVAILDGSLDSLCRETDALLLDLPGLQTAFGCQRLGEQLQRVFATGRSHSLPCMLQSRPAACGSPDPTAPLGEWLGLGPHALILDAARQEDAQAALDAFLVAREARAGTPAGAAGGIRGASLAGRPTFAA